MQLKLTEDCLIRDLVRYWKYPEDALGKIINYQAPIIKQFPNHNFQIPNTNLGGFLNSPKSNLNSQFQNYKFQPERRLFV